MISSEWGEVVNSVSINQYRLFFVEMQAGSSDAKTEEYEEINGCTNEMPGWQVLALVMMIAIETLMFYLIADVVELSLVILFVLYPLNGLVLIMVVYYYILLSLSDPSDPRLKDKNYTEQGQKLVECKRCQANVSQTSHHCHSCRRCVEGFDHHCVFLNNCIGKSNYTPFFRLLIVLIIHTTLNISIGLVMFFSIDDGFKWVGMVLAGLSFLVFLEVTVLAIFHCYISFVLYKTTLQVIRGDRESSKGAVGNGSAKGSVKSKFDNIQEVRDELHENTEVGINKSK